MSSSQHSRKITLLNSLAGFAILCFGTAVQAGGPTCVPLATIGVAATQNFDTLAIAGTTNALTITGWFLTETGGGARDNEQYAFDNGGSNTGDTYSYGTTTVAERALGGLQSGTLIPVIGACLVNNTGTTLTSLDIAYTGEQWRLGTAARTDQLDFEFSLDAVSLTTGAWSAVNALDFVTPNTVGAGAKDGNAVGNFTLLSQTIPTLSIAPGGIVFVRWLDANASGADDGLSVDNFSVTPQGVAASADVSLGKTLDTAGPYIPGQAVIYTLTVANAGPSTATNIQVTDTPTNLTVTSVSGSGCAALPCTIPSLASGANTAITVNATITAAGAFDNSATATATETDPTPANNTDNTGNGGTAAASADVSIGKTLTTAGPFIIGQTVSYTLTVANAGPSTATNVTVTDTPTNLAITGVGGACASFSPCVIASIASGANAVITVTATINAAGTFDNAASATATESDPSGANNTDPSGNGGVAGASADVSLGKTLDTAGPYVAGQTVSYTLTIANAGPSTANSIQVTDTPVNLTITAVSGSGCAALPCTIASLASGANTAITVTAAITAAGAFDNSATATSTDSDPNAANNTDNTGNGGTAAASADVSIDKTLTTAGPFIDGQSVTYALTVANAGPSTATNIQVTDTPSNLTITSVNGGGCAALPCTIPSLASGANVVITVTAQITGAAFDNSATATAAESDPNGANNTDNTGNGSSSLTIDVPIPALDRFGQLLIALLVLGFAALSLRRHGN